MSKEKKRRAKIVLATANLGKLRELRSLLPSCLEVVGAAELGLSLPPETGNTFVENALLKARAAARATGCIALADDSGLEIDALGGRPGVHSAHYAGPNASAEENVRRVLEELEGVPLEQRTARFRAVIAIAAPDGREALSEGIVEGHISLSPRGEGGFGYDPIFVPEGEELTFAEMPLAEKNRRSHRALALEKALETLWRWSGCEEELAGLRDDHRSLPANDGAASEKHGKDKRMSSCY